MSSAAGCRRPGQQDFDVGDGGSARWLREDTAKISIGFKSVRLRRLLPRTYRETNARADAFAHALCARGLVPGDRVALLLDNCPEVLE